MTELNANELSRVSKFLAALDEASRSTGVMLDSGGMIEVDSKYVGSLSHTTTPETGFRYYTLWDPS